MNESWHLTIDDAATASPIPKRKHTTTTNEKKRKEMMI